MVYILNKDGKPLMPTERYGKVKHMLKDGRAKAVKRTPFTIQLTYETAEYTQPVTLGIDAGSKVVGLSATTENKELFASEVELRNDIVKKISQRKEERHKRRNHKTRYRKPRFKNRKRKKPWIAPSIQNKIDTHLRVICDVHKILPIKKIVVETASFDIDKIKNPNITKEERQQGEQLGFWNVREYVLCRDGHTCQCCGGKSKDPILNVHHIESRQTGGNAPNNLITLCETCHKKYHQGKIELPQRIKRGTSFKDATFMGIMRWALYGKLKETYNNVHMTFGYITKTMRINNELPKAHYIDARCISGNPNAKPLGIYYYQKKVRCHNRKLYRATIMKGGKKRRNQAKREMFGFKLFDRVNYNGKEYFVFSRRSNGTIDIRTLEKPIKNISVNYKKIKWVESSKHLLVEKRAQIA